MPDRKKWYQFFVQVENENTPSEEVKEPFKEKEEKVEEVAKVETAPEAQALAGHPEELPTFNQIYQSVGIKIPSHGFSVYKIEEMLKSPYLKDMNNEARANCILMALEAVKVPIEEIIQDAINRDKALDNYEKFMEKKLHDFESRKIEENRTIQEEVERFINEKREQIKNNDRVIQGAREKLHNWQAQKQIEEQRIFETLKYFTPEQALGSIYSSPIKPPDEKKKEEVHPQG